MSRALAAHGPDAEGFWIGAGIGLGQRLRRVMREDRFERQPLVGSGGCHVLVCDGRIDGRDELAQELGTGTAAPAGVPDSALVLRAYERWGEGCASHLIGDFVFAVWNARERQLILARSPMFGRPLFYFRSAEMIAFATAPSGLFALPGVPRALNEEFLADYLAHERPQPGSSFYRGLERLLPGHTLVVTMAGAALRRHAPSSPRRQLRLARDEDYVLAFDEVFTRVMRDQLRAEGGVGLLLSGGLDSTSIAATAAPMLEQAGEGLLSFTEVPRRGFDGPVLAGRYADERPYVEALSQRYRNLTPIFIDTTGRFLLDGLAETFEALERPYHRPTNRVWYEAAFESARERGVRIMLHGAQGNLTISWHGDGLLSQLCRDGRWRAAFREARLSARARSPAGVLRVLAGEGLLPLLPTPVYLAVGRARFPQDAVGWSHQPWRTFSAVSPAFARVHRVDERARARRPDSRLRLQPDTAQQRSDVIARLADVTDGTDAGYHARFGIEARDPTGDARIVEFCLSLPEGQYRRDGQSRWLVRRAMRSRLPPEILDNRSRGLQAADWLERMLGARDRIEDALAALERSSLARQAIDLPRLKRLTAALAAADPAAQTTLNDYRGRLESGLMVGQFILWFERGAAA